jgi:hypothetical protein
MLAIHYLKLQDHFYRQLHWVVLKIHDFLIQYVQNLLYIQIYICTHFFIGYITHNINL